MRTEIAWAELHAPLFLNGTNLQQKLDPTKRQGLKMAYDEEKRHLYVSFGGKVARVPETSVLSMVEAGEAKPVSIFSDTSTKPSTASTTIVTVGTDKAFNHQGAQASTPMEHVHAGPGHGQTGQEPVKAKGKK